MKTNKLIIALIGLSTLIGVQTANAAVLGNQYPICALAIFPYWPEAPEIIGSAGNAYLNFRDDLCTGNLTYPAGAAKAYPESELTDAKVPLKAGADGKKVPIGYHEHSYYNDSKDDDKYYKAFVKAFQIKLQPDAVANVDKFYCDYPYPGSGTIPASYTSIVPSPAQVQAALGEVCKNWKGASTVQTGYISNLWGGTKIEYNPSAQTVTWIFAVDKTDWYPVFYGDNDTTDGNWFDGIIGLDTSVNSNRKFTNSIKLETKNLAATKKIWAATTTSRVLLRNMGVTKSVAQNDPSVLTKGCTTAGNYNQGWCSLPAGGTVVSTYNGQTLPPNFFWFDIGNVVSIWKSPVTPPPVELACADLQWDGAFLKKNSLSVFAPATKNPNALLPNEEAVMKFKTIYESGSGTKRPLEYRWVSFYGDQNRPAWFANDDTLFIVNFSGTTLAPFLTNSLPVKLLNVAHAAPLSVEDTITSLKPSATDLATTTAIDSAITAMTNIGKFKDELSSGLLLNPLTDDDFQAYYSGGSEGVILGVQAFYADGKNIAGQGAMVSTPGGLKQKAEPCHLELVIQPAPAICIDLEISPKDIKPNTPVTFTVTPKFSPADQTIPLNYYWNAKASASGIIEAVKDPGFSIIDFDPSILGSIGMATTEDTGKNWTVEGLGDLIDTGKGIQGLIDPCANGGCETLPPKFDFGGPVEESIYDFGTSGLSTPNLGSGFVTKDFGSAIGGANVLADFSDLSEYGKAALPPIGSVSDSIGSISAADVGISPGVLGSLGSGDIDIDGATADEIIYGAFKDSQSTSGTATNPFLETTDNKTYYTGGPSGTLITVEGRGKDGTVYPPCKDSLIIPEIPLAPKCQQLKVKFLDGSTEVAKENLVAGKTYTVQIDQANSKKTDGTPVTKYTLNVGNVTGAGYVTLDPTSTGTCSPIVIKMGGQALIGTGGASDVTCKYNYTPKAGDKITLLADPHDNVAACRVEQVIPSIPVGPICQALNLTTSPALIGGQIPLNTQIALTTNPRDTDNNLREPVVYEKSGSGVFIINVTNASSCPVPANSAGFYTFEAPSTCKYSFLATTAGPGDYVSVRVKQDDGVAACKVTMPVVDVPEDEEICQALNLKVNGAYTLNPLLTPGSSYSLQADPITTKGNPITMVEWTENGSGQLVGEAGNPGICPAVINNQSLATPAFCRYIYSSPSGASDTDGFSVRAVPDDGVIACRAKAEKFNPPKENPYCLYLDLDYTPEPFNPLTSTQMMATVVMSDGSKYNDNVRFTSTNGEGEFSGGFAPTSGSGTSNFRSKTDATNNTQMVTYSGGNEDSGLNVFLSDTSIVQTAACQRQLKPVKQPDYQCELPPNIVRDGRKFTAEGGDSDQYCWSISGAGNPLFTNGQDTATGDSVIIEEDYASFDLRVEDCNPEFRDICSDEYEIDNTPNINKRISKNSSPLRYGTKINYSTTGDNSAQTVAYKIEFTPSNYQPGTYMIAKIYDPAFTGKLQGYKSDANGGGKTAGGTVDFNNIESTLKINGYALCSGTPTPKDKCYSVNKSAGFLQLNGISSTDKIAIEYTGILKSGITLADCREGKYCNEQFINQSFVTDMSFCVEQTGEGGTITYDCTDAPKPSDQKCEYFYNDKGERVPVGGNDQDCKMPKFTMATNTTVAELVCQYFLTRASGDIFLEDELKYGIDVSKCYPFKNISSTITKPTTPIPPTAPKTGTPEVVTINHEICSAGQSNFTGFKDNAQKEALMKLFGADISKLSSQICEVGLVPGSDWDKASINASMAQNIGKLTRWDDGINPGNNISNVNDIINEGRIYYYKGSGSETVTIDSLSIPEGSGALTIIVENADLQINGNVEYAIGTPADTADKISSLGVIVIDGNMYVEKDVEKLAGAYFVQRLETENYTVGNVLSGSKGSVAQSEKMLTVNGSIYGNIGPLFENRVAAGDITKDEGAITIRYDQRIIQNPPAGLAQILGDFSQSQIAQ